MDRTELAVLAGMLIGGGLVYLVMKWQARWDRKFRFPQYVPHMELSTLVERVQCCLEEVELQDAERCEYRYGVQYTPQEMSRWLQLRHRYLAQESEV